MKLEPGNRWNRVVAVALLLPVCGCISLRGMHSIPKLEGVVVDMETGEPVEGVALEIRYCFANHDLYENLAPGGGPGMTWTSSMETTSGPDGHFELPGYWGPEGSCGAVWEAYKSGYVPLKFKYGASRKKREVWFTWNRYDTSWQRNIDYRWERRHVFVTLKLEPVRGTDPEVWERYLEKLAHKAEGYGPEGWDFRWILLDEAYRYVSQGGEVTEGIVTVFYRNFLTAAKGIGRYSDERRRAIACWAVEGCKKEPTIEWCRSHPKTLARLAIRQGCKQSQ